MRGRRAAERAGRTRGGRVAATPALCLLLVGCGADSATPIWSGEVRDSAGITVVHNRGPGLWGEDRAWTVREDLAIGALDGPPETVFGHVADLAVDGAGRLWVLDQQAQEVRVFGPDGTFLRRVGGPGEGPGELSRFAFSVLVRADTVIVADWAAARLSRFDTAGAFLSSERMPVAGASRSWWAVAQQGYLFRSLARYTDEDGRWLGLDALLRHTGRAAPDTVLVFDYPQTDIGTRTAVKAPLLVNTPAWAVLTDGRIAWTTLEAERIRIVAPDGTLERLVSADAWERRPPTGGETEAMVEGLGEKLQMLGGSRETVRQLELVAPDRLPALTGVVAGTEGTLWAQRMGDAREIHPMALNSPDPPTGFGGTTWDVLDPDGRLLGSVELPPRFRVLEITAGAVFGVRRDELDVERVERLTLVRP